MNREEIRKKWKNRELAEISQKKLARQEDTQASPTKQVSSWERVQNTANQILTQQNQIQTKQLSPETMNQINNLVAQSKQVNTSGMQRLGNQNLATQMQIQNRNNTQPITAPSKGLKKDKGEIQYKAEQLKKEEEQAKELASQKGIGNKALTKASQTLENVFQKPKTLYNGYQFGDITKTIGSTAGGIGSHIIGGVEQVANFIPQTFGYGMATISRAMGKDKIAEAWIKATQDEQKDREDVRNKIFDVTDKSSLLGKTGNQVAEGVGQSVTFGATGKVAGGALTFGQGFGSGLQESYSQKDVKDWQAWLKATGSGVVSYLSENIFENMGYGGSGIDNAIKNKVTRAIESGLGKALARTGISALGEGTEEILESLGNTGVNAIMNYITKLVGSGAKFDTEVDIEDLVESATIGFLSGGFGEGSSIFTNNAMQSNARINEIEQQTGKKLTNEEKQAIRNETLYNSETQQENEIIIDKSKLTDEQKEALKNVALNNNLSNQETEKLIQDTLNGKINVNEQNQATTTPNNEILNQEQQTIQQEGKQAQNQMSQETDEKEQKALNLRQSIDNFNNSRQEGQEIFDINNEETRKEIESIQKIAQDRNINIIFDENRFNNTDTNAFYEYDKDNNVANIVLNPNSTSKKYVQNLVIHEMTHSFEGSKEYNNLSKAILDYAKSKGEYDSAFKDLMNTYSKVYSGENLNEIVEKEAVANILGEKLGDKEFVDSLVNNQYVERSTIQKIIDFIKNQINRFKGYKDQEAYWNHVKTLFEDAYNKSEVSKEGLKASVERNNQLNEIETFSTDSYEGQTNHVKQITDKDGNVVAKLEYAYYDGRNHVQMIEVDPKYRRQGLAKKLLQSLQEETPDAQIFFGMTTPDGTKLIENITEQVKNPLYNERKAKKINKLETQARELRKQIEGYNDKLRPYAEKNRNGTLTEQEHQEWSRLSKEQSALMEQEREVNEKWYELDQKVKSDELREYNTFVKLDDNKQYSIETTTTDSQGRELSKGQQEYFKDSKVRDENGNLKTMYHGTEANVGIPQEYWFSIFDVGRQGNNGSWFGNGFYFTENEEHAKEYAHSKGSVYEVYLDVKKPYIPYQNGNSMLSFQEDFKNNFEEARDIDGKLTGQQITDILKKNGYDGIIIGDNTVVFNSNQIKNVDNTNPTTNPDIRYSQDTTGAWNNFIEKYFKNEGTGTAIKDMKKLPEMSITKYQEVLDNAKYIPQEDKQNLLSYLEDIKKNKSSLDDFKKIVNDLNNTYKQDNVLDTTETYSTGRKEKYQKYLKSKTDYDNSSLRNAMNIIPANKQGKRTKEQWLNVAKQIGTEIANKSNQEIEEIAFRTWQDERPSSKESMNRQGQKFVPFNSDEWINAIYDSVNEQRQYSVDTEQQTENQAEQQENVEQQAEQPVEQTVKEEKTRKKILNPTEISNLKLEDANTTPELKDKKYKKGTKESNFAENIENDVGFLTEEQKKEILKDDNVKYYAPVTNADTLAKAFNNLNENGQNATYEWYAKPTDNATAEDVATGWILLKQYADKGDTQGMVNVAKKMRDMGTKAGQTVQAFNILSRLTPEGMVAYTQGELQDAYNEMVKGKTKKWIDEHKGDFDLSQEEVAFIMDTMQNLPAENPDTNNYERKVALGQIQKLFTDKIPAEGGKIKAWMRISMLFNPKTQVRNVAGNVGIVPVNAFSDFLGSKVDAIVAKKTGVRTLGNPNAKSYLKGAGQGLYQSYNDFKLGINTRGIEGSKFEFGEGNSFNNKGLGKALNRTENILNFVMDAGDRAFSQGSFVNSLNNQMVLNGVDTPTQEMIDIATQEALSRTWNDNNEYTNFVLGIRKGLNKIGFKSYGLGDVLIPFAKTPANLTKAIVDYSPVGLVKSVINGNNLKNAIETGQFTPMQQHKFVDDLGKALAGTLLYVAGYGLAKAGIATGEADDDKDVKNFMKNSLGIGSYSIKVGDKSFAYDWAQPVATPLAIMTNLYKTNKENPDATLLEKALNAVNIGTNQVMEQSFMESLNEVLNGNGEITERIQKAILDLPARAIPTFSKQIADMVDSTQRTSFEYGQPVKSSINAVKAKIPFASKTLTPVVDTLGNEVKRYGGENNLFNVFLNPSNMNKGQLSQAGKEIYNVYMQTGDTKVFPVTAPYYINYKGDKITMTSKQKADYQRIAGKYTEEVINKLLNNDSYKSLTDEEKAEVLTNVVNDSNSKAKKDVLNIENKNSNIDLIEKIGSNYYTFKVDLKNALDKKRQETGKETANLSDSEKISVLRNENYSKKEKDLLYSNDIGKDDVVYDYMKLLNSNSLSFIDGYFDYKNSGKKVEELKEFLDNNKDLTYMQKLYLTSINNSSPDNIEREKLRNYINSLNITDKQKDEIKSKIRYVEKNDNGMYVWKTKKK